MSDNTAPFDKAAQTPNDILEDPALPAHKKRQLLEDWRLDLLERQTATEENMAGSESASAEISEQLRLVNKALNAISPAR